MVTARVFSGLRGQDNTSRARPSRRQPTRAFFGCPGERYRHQQPPTVTSRVFRRTSPSAAGRLCDGRDCAIALGADRRRGVSSGTGRGRFSRQRRRSAPVRLRTARNRRVDLARASVASDRRVSQCTGAPIWQRKTSSKRMACSLPLPRGRSSTSLGGSALFSQRSFSTRGS